MLSLVICNFWGFHAYHQLWAYHQWFVFRSKTGACKSLNKRCCNWYRERGKWEDRVDTWNRQAVYIAKWHFDRKASESHSLPKQLLPHLFFWIKSNFKQIYPSLWLYDFVLADAQALQDHQSNWCHTHLKPYLHKRNTRKASLIKQLRVDQRRHVLCVWMAGIKSTLSGSCCDWTLLLLWNMP